MTNKLAAVLREIGPCLSGAAAEHLEKRFSVSYDAARQQVARRQEPVRELKLDFPRRARFLYLPDQWQSSEFWSSLAQALEGSGGAYARTIWALSARGGMLPACQFAAATAIGDGDGQVGAEAVKAGLIEAGLLQEVEIAGIGSVIGYPEAISNEHMVAQLRARLLAEEVLLASLMEWARRLNLGSWGAFRLRGDDTSPSVGRFAFDLSAPSYVSPMPALVNDKLRSGFLAMDVALVGLDEKLVKPFIYKIETMRKVSRLTRYMQFVVADGYTKDALVALRNAGIVSATSESIFGQDVAAALRGLIATLTQTAQAAVDPARFEELFSVLRKLPGADGTLRGALFEFLCAEIARSSLGLSNVVMNRMVRKTGKDVAEIDVRGETGVDLHFVEAKGLLPGNVLNDEEVERWLNTRIPAIEKHYRDMPEFAHRTFHFELWTSGELSEEAKLMVSKRQSSVRKTKYTLRVRYGSELAEMARGSGDTSSLKVLDKHFLEHPLAEAWNSSAINIAPASLRTGMLGLPEAAPMSSATSLRPLLSVQTSVEQS